MRNVRSVRGISSSFIVLESWTHRFGTNQGRRSRQLIATIDERKLSVARRDRQRTPASVDAEMEHAGRSSSDLASSSARDQYQDVAAQRMRVTVDDEMSGPGLDEHQHVDVVVDVFADRPAGIESDEIGVEIATVGQAPHCALPVGRCGTAEVGDDEVGRRPSAPSARPDHDHATSNASRTGSSVRLQRPCSVGTATVRSTERRPASGTERSSSMSSHWSGSSA